MQEEKQLSKEKELSEANSSCFLTLEGRKNVVCSIDKILPMTSFISSQKLFSSNDQVDQKIKQEIVRKSILNNFYERNLSIFSFLKSFELKAKSLKSILPVERDSLFSETQKSLIVPEQPAVLVERLSQKSQSLPNIQQASNIRDNSQKTLMLPQHGLELFLKKERQSSLDHLKPQPSMKITKQQQLEAGSSMAPSTPSSIIDLQQIKSSFQDKSKLNAHLAKHVSFFPRERLNSIKKEPTTIDLDGFNVYKRYGFEQQHRQNEAVIVGGKSAGDDIKCKNFFETIVENSEEDCIENIVDDSKDVSVETFENFLSASKENFIENTVVNSEDDDLKFLQILQDYQVSKKIFFFEFIKIIIKNSVFTN